MAQLAIKGHKSRGNEVIEILEMLGGINSHNLYGDENYAYYTIDDDKEIKGGIYVFGDEPYTILTLEEFLEKFPYKIGDEVFYHETYAVVTQMKWDGREIVYTVESKKELWKTTVFYLQPYKEETMEDKPDLLQQLKDYFDNTSREVIEKEWHEYDKYNEIGPTVNEYLEYVNKIRHPQYPKTYEECCEVLSLGEDGRLYTKGYKASLIQDFQKLLICRDAYWKIAGEQMGLGKPWEPDWSNDLSKYYISFYNKKVDKGFVNYSNKILAFPTEEMRDAFKENFDSDIEFCKEFL